jgi:hypothetical protein
MHSSLSHFISHACTSFFVFLHLFSWSFSLPRLLPNCTYISLSFSFSRCCPRESSSFHVNCFLFLLTKTAAWQQLPFSLFLSRLLAAAWSPTYSFVLSSSLSPCCSSFSLPRVVSCSSLLSHTCTYPFVLFHTSREEGASMLPNCTRSSRERIAVAPLFSLEISSLKCP